MKKPDYPVDATEEQKAQIDKDFRADIAAKRNSKSKPKPPTLHA